MIPEMMNRTSILDINHTSKNDSKENSSSVSCYLGSLSHPWGLFSHLRSQRHHDISPSLMQRPIVDSCKLVIKCQKGQCLSTVWCTEGLSILQRFSLTEENSDSDVPQSSINLSLSIFSCKPRMKRKLITLKLTISLLGHIDKQIMHIHAQTSREPCVSLHTSRMQQQ